MENKAKPSFVGLIPFLIFVAIYLGTGVVLQMKGVGMAFYQLPAPVAVFVGIIAAFILFKGTIMEKFDTFLEGCGHQDIITMCIIYLLAGAFAGVSKAMGGVDATVNMGLTYIPAHYIAAGLFIIASFISTATGTSVGAIVSITPIAVGLAEKSGVPLPLILAAVMGGAMFGDNLSVISDTTIAATKTQGVEMRDKFRVNLYIAAPAAIITIILLLVFGKPDHVPHIEVLAYNFLKVLPYLVVLILAITGINVFVVLTSGIFLSGIIGLAHGDFTLLSLTNEIYNGFLGMNEIFLLSLLTGGLATMSTKAGGIQWLIEQIQKIIVGKKSAKIGVGLLVAVTDMAVANNTVAIIINGSIAKKICQKYNVDLRESAAILDIFSCIFQGLIPYGAQMLILLGFTAGKVSPLDIIPLLWYQLLLFIFTVVFIFFSINEKIIAKLDKNKVKAN
ncbi:Na+/H+ antiporter NhaC family protein [Fusobacterium ulcerans]|uniref:Na+/H+ antiporter NhaC family protein n=1 Tax=Fusobacterium ulcerans TaxID=861 RepID=UPI001D0A447F|nr:Na+/H+ antiporter NhaC family protein [Fusobacterium ulcerans]MCB8563533.1 Na+/H+ antiporter NhaC family protein [Fusobacterium ulcerans]MCB8647800.1 Na+/H+ antiporter NhaC family protein [Fusobacterium ulcerans]